MNIKKSGHRLNNYRQALGLSMEEMGKILGIARQTVASYENNITPIPVKIVMMIEKMTGSGQYIMGFSTKPFNKSEREDHIRTMVNILTKPGYREEFFATKEVQASPKK